MEDIEQKPVMVAWYQCGKSIESVGDPSYIALSKDLSRKYRKYSDQGRKVETITMKEFKKLPFMCGGVEDCPDKKK